MPMPDREKVSRIGPKDVLFRHDQPMKPPFQSSGHEIPETIVALGKGMVTHLVRKSRAC